MADTAQPTAVALDDATVAFRVAGRPRLYRGGTGQPVRRAWRIRRHRRSDRMRKIDAAQCRRRAVEARRRIGEDLRSAADGLNRDAGYLFQADALFPWKTAIDNVAIGLDIKGAPRAQALQRAQGWLTSVGLGAFANRYPHMLSGGQRKRVGLAQVLIRDPKILLMDEPFGPLDAQTRQIMGNLLLELWNADRKAVLFVTHDLEEAIALADRVVIMSAGPGARIIGDWRVPLPRPRDISEMRMEKEFHELHREIWSVLKDEVMKGYAQSRKRRRRSDVPPDAAVLAIAGRRRRAGAVAVLRHRAGVRPHAAAAVLLLQSGRCRQPDRQMVFDRRDLEASCRSRCGSRSWPS